MMCDALAVLGSRHGLVFNPVERKASLIRFSRFGALPEVHLRAGLEIGGRTVILKLAPEGDTFFFHDQRLTPCTMALKGLDPGTNTKVTLTVISPFRPRDGDFSTTPVLHLRLTAEPLPGNFRWMGKEKLPETARLFLEIDGPDFTLSPNGRDAVDVAFESVAFYPVHEQEGPIRDGKKEPVGQKDRLVGLSGERDGTRFVQDFTPIVGEETVLDVAWCTWSEPMLQIHGEKKPFRYAKALPSLDAVADWARANPTALVENAAKVDGILLENNLAQPVNQLLAQTLHSWLINTWWVDRDGRDWVSTWEGNCYFHSTVDVEFTQSPFYLAVWPELLASELDFWPEFAKDGERCLGERGKGTKFLSHDVGSGAACNGQVYHHEMEVEEAANYLILAFAYWRRTGDDSLLRKHAGTIKDFAAFIRACDTTGNGIPDKGVANTIDDASPAVQFGTEQVYLAVKALAGLACAEQILFHVKGADDSFLQDLGEACGKIRAALDDRGWNAKGKFYHTLLEKSGELTNPWTGEKVHFDEIPGWDAPHIYTANALPPLDMVGFSLGLDETKLGQDLVHATARCLREYGCVHTDFANEQMQDLAAMEGLAGASSNPGWIAMNMLRDLAAAYRGVDLRDLSARYWNWQQTVNSQEPRIFSETFGGNNLSWYPRGLGFWGLYDAFRGRVLDKVANKDESRGGLPGVKVNDLLGAEWR